MLRHPAPPVIKSRPPWRPARDVLSTKRRSVNKWRKGTRGSGATRFACKSLAQRVRGVAVDAFAFNQEKDVKVKEAILLR